jgi:hypothetical protein
MTSDWIIVIAYNEEALREFFTSWFNDCILIGSCSKSRVSLSVRSAPVNVFELEVRASITIVSL